MEPTEHTPGEQEYSEFTEHERFALTLYDDADRLFTELGADSYYEKINNRYIPLPLPEKYLDGINEILATNIIDPADSVDIIINGANPYKPDSDQDTVTKGVLWMNLRHGDLVTSYVVWVNKYPAEGAPPIKATKYLFQISNRNLKRGETYDPKEAADPEDVIYAGEPVGQFEQHALRDIITHLRNVLPL